MEFIDIYINKLKFKALLLNKFSAQNKLYYFDFLNKNFNICDDIIRILCWYSYDI